MLVVADINTLWRKKPFEALGLQTQVLGLAPQDVMAAWKRMHRGSRPAPQGHYVECPITLPPGWASKWTKLTAWRLWQQAQGIAQKLRTSVSGLVVTSPHYVDLVRHVRPRVPCYYYCSDDYSEYHAWGGEALLKQEAALVQSVEHSFFVSRTLADRAAHTFGVSADRIAVSPNGTEERFLNPVPQAKLEALFHEFPALRRPLVGVVGGINDRLDFDLIARCAALPEVGSIVMVGGVDVGSCGPELRMLQTEPKIVFAGQRPHDELPVWMQALDVALIPYRHTRLNLACSPMRLFDHLASGRRIVATRACAQVVEMSSWVDVGRDAGEICRLIVSALTAEDRGRAVLQLEMAKAHLWSARAAGLLQVMSAYAP